MPSYYRLILGPKSAYAEECFAGGFVGVNFDMKEDLTGKLPEVWRDFNKAYIPVFLAGHPGKSKVAAGLACGSLWTVAKGISKGDVILGSDGSGGYRIGDVTGDYVYVKDGNLPHRRAVAWRTGTLQRSSMTDALRHSSGSVSTVCDLSEYREELDRLTGVLPAGPKLVSTDPEVEDAAAFAMEKHLEDFLVANWGATDLGKEYDIYEVDGEQVGQQFLTDTGPLDILAVSKDRTRLLVVELKKGRPSDAVVGQVLRYMGFVKDELAEKKQTVEGVIIALEDDIKIRRALSSLGHIRFYRYQVSFKLVKG